jgi:D-alanyl-D-alanine carboxypeptidase
MAIYKVRYIFLALIFCFQFGCGGSGGSNQIVTATQNISTSSASLSSSLSSSAASSSSATRLTLTEKIDSYLDANQKADEPGISILVVKNGKIAYRSSKGMADITAGTSISAQTGFLLASVSKPFTAIAIMQLVEKGQLHVTDSLLDYIPELPSSWRKITIEHLLTHRSGIYDVINDGWRPALLNGMTNNSLLYYLIKNPALEFEPGTKGDYSNTGYALLATVVERVTGVSFPEYMRLNVFSRANMNSYIANESQEIKYGDALNYARLRTYYGITNYLIGSSGQVSSTEDFLNFFEALRTAKIITESTLAIMSQPHGTLNGGVMGYGFGISGDALTHAGQWDGFETEVSINFRTGIDSVILTNSGSSGRKKINEIMHIIYSTSF